MKSQSFPDVASSALFAPLRLRAAGLLKDKSFDRLHLQDLLNHYQVKSGGDQSLKLIAPPVRSQCFEEQYEVRIFQQGELALRPDNWHDYFNAMVWLCFPLTKAQLNRRHYFALCDQKKQGLSLRGRSQDAWTLFDESGMIVTSEETSLLDCVKSFSWKTLFWERRQAVLEKMSWWVVGHAIYEKALAPYVGMTGHSVLPPVDKEFKNKSPLDQLAYVDKTLSESLADSNFLMQSRDLAPLPFLGIPGWWADNENAGFYDNEAYFRKGRKIG